MSPCWLLGNVIWFVNLPHCGVVCLFADQQLNVCPPASRCSSWQLSTCCCCNRNCRTRRRRSGSSCRWSPSSPEQAKEFVQVFFPTPAQTSVHYQCIDWNVVCRLLMTLQWLLWSREHSAGSKLYSKDERLPSVTRPCVCVVFIVTTKSNGKFSAES